jgi:hypothetical protein
MIPDMTPNEVTAILDEKNSPSTLAAIASHVKRLNPGIDEEKLSADLADRSSCHTTLRGPLLIMEAQCEDLEEPSVFHLFRSREPVPWRGAPIKLWLACLYRQRDMARYIVESQRVLKRASLPQFIQGALRDDS